MAAGTAPRIVVLGGGFGGLETAFALRDKLGPDTPITVVSEQAHFLFKPNTIYIPFGMDPARLTVPLARPLAKRDITFVHGRAREVDAAGKRVEVEQFEGMQRVAVPYDYLVVATGAGMRPAEIPGLAAHARTVWTPADMLRLRKAFAALVEDAKAGQRRRVVFVLPPHNKWAGPLYELALMLDTWLTRKKVRSAVDLTWTTHEQTYFQDFGPRLHEVVRDEFVRRSIWGHPDYVVAEVTEREVRYKNRQVLPYDLLVTFPPYVAATPFPGLPADERGFVVADLATRRVPGHPEIYAVGDAADFPVKQAYLAVQQAEAAADQLAGDIRGKLSTAAFEPTTRYVMEQLDTATFAQVPLRVGEGPLPGVEVAAAKRDRYLVGTSPLWRTGKQLLGRYLPQRFGAGDPLQSGIRGKGLEVGVKALSSLLATCEPPRVPPTRR